jgi:RHS repeat-associated protein
MTPDPLLNSGQPWNPQTWNRYSYTLNNPLRYTDPLGLYVWGNCSGDADKCKAEQQRFRDSITKAQEALKGLDPNTGRTTSYSASVGVTPQVISGTLTWNANGTLQKNNVSDAYNPANTQNCAYQYDDFVRAASVNCLNGSTNVWNQNFTYGTDSFGNLTKTVPAGGTGASWAPGYNAANNQYTLTGTQYDSDGGLTNDSFHTYTWLPDGHVASVTTGTNIVSITYDAMGNKVEENHGGAVQEYVSEFGVSAQMTGQTENSTLIDLPGGVQALYSGGTLQRFRFPDWQGTIRAESSTARAFTESLAFAPFGERYAVKGTPFNADSFTGKPDQIVGDEYDFEARELHDGQGRWISPDPMRGTGNKYAYADNNPLSRVDLFGLIAALFLANQSDFLSNSDSEAIESDLLATEGDESHPQTHDQTPGDGCLNCEDKTDQSQTLAQNNEWSLSWQFNASASFLGQEVKGVYDTTLAPVVDAAAHPVQTVENAASNLVEGVKDVAKDPKGTLTGAAEGAKDLAVQFGSKVASGDPCAIGQAAGLVVDAYIAVRGVQGKEIKVNDNLRIAPTGNRTGGVGELPHYHQRIVGPDGKTVPGGGIGWHRPWEP